jgi:GT2 family glycosyltransferase
MSTGIGVVVATFGDEDHWGRLAAYAMESAEDQAVCPDNILWCHGGTLAEARNAGAMEVGTEWVVFLDADDTLGHHYIESMAAAKEDDDGRTLFQPQTAGVHNRYEEGAYVEEPVFITPAASLLDRNHMVIGTMVSMDLFSLVGGFREFQMYEDWDLWLRCWILGGARWTQVEGAVYEVTVRPDGRNNQDGKTQIRVYNQIRGEMLREARARGLS